MTTHYCPSCRQHLPASDFHKNTKRKNGLAVYCKICMYRRYAKPEWMLHQLTHAVDQLARDIDHSKSKMDLRRSRFDYDGIQPILWRDLLHRY